MGGWIIPPPKPPAKTKAEFQREREKRVQKLISQGYLKAERIRKAMMKVAREDFIPDFYRDYAYQEVPLPLPGEESTISCPHSYPLFYEPLELNQGHRFLEVGLGSGYGTALAREIVGPEGLVVSIEIDPTTYEFARINLEKAGYSDVILIRDDGGLGYPQWAPYDRICITAACHQIPPPLIRQLAFKGKLISPIIEGGIQNLVLLEKKDGDLEKTLICEVLYVSFRGKYGLGYK